MASRRWESTTPLRSKRSRPWRDCAQRENKTETAKRILQFFGTLGATGAPGEYTLEQRIISTNPILESFGCASTMRNHNSSRFGKFVVLRFR